MASESGRHAHRLDRERRTCARERARGENARAEPGGEQRGQAPLREAASLRKLDATARRSARSRSARRRSCPRVALEQGEQDMIAPRAVDLEIAARVALALEAVALEQRDRGLVVGNAGGLDAMQPQRRRKRIRRSRRPRGSCAPCRHGRRPSSSRASPVCDDAAADAAERHAAEHFVGRLVENQEGVGFVAGDVFLLTLEPPAKGRAG